MKRICNVNTGRVLLTALAALLTCAGLFRLSLPQSYATSAITDATLQQMQRQSENLPCVVPQTDLLAQHLVCYEGPFLEDGSDLFVVNVAALSVKNIGSADIEAAEILLQRDDALLTFRITALPAGETVLVLEKNAAKYEKGEYKVSSGWQTESAVQWLSPQQISYSQTGMSELDFTNKTDTVIPDVQIYYKNYLSECDILIGGISNRVWLGTLQPGESASISLPKYASGYSKIVCIMSGRYPFG